MLCNIQVIGNIVVIVYFFQKHYFSPNTLKSNISGSKFVLSYTNRDSLKLCCYKGLLSGNNYSFSKRSNGVEVLQRIQRCLRNTNNG